MNFLIVVAHPDDEVLGAGGAIYNWTRQNQVDVCIMCTKAEARSHHPGETSLETDMMESAKYLGTHHIHEGLFPNIEMNNVPHLHLVQFIEKAILESKPDIVITHHAADTNNDHMQTSIACQEAVRIFERRPEVKPIKELWYMEGQTASEWTINTAINNFRPNCFVEVGKEGVDAKIKALGLYRGVMRPYPHPRSAEYISGLAAVRGSQWGVMYAEGFEVALRWMCFQ